jgi:hypothetical protein
VLPRPADEVRGDQEVAGIVHARVADHAELVLDPLLQIVRDLAVLVAVAFPGALPDPGAEHLRLRGDLLREREGRHVVLLLELDVDLVGDLQRVLEHVGAAGEPLGHLLMALEVEAAVVLHPVRVGVVLAEPDAEQDVVGAVVVGLQEVRVVGRDHGQAEVVAEPEDLLVQLVLARRVVALHLEVVAAVEELRVPGRRLARLVPAVLHEVLRDLAGQAGAGDDQALRVPRSTSRSIRGLK